MSITINGSGTIGGISVGGLPDGIVDSDTLAPNTAGSVIQVVSASTATEVVNGTSTYVDTGLSATITPTSATSKVLVLVTQKFYYSKSSTETQGVGIRVYRDAVLIYDPPSDATGPREDLLGLSNVLSVSRRGAYNRTILDSPNTTGTVTYKTQGRPYSAANGGSASFQNSGTSTITLIEVAA